MRLQHLAQLLAMLLSFASTSNDGVQLNTEWSGRTTYPEGSNFLAALTPGNIAGSRTLLQNSTETPTELGHRTASIIKRWLEEETDYDLTCHLRTLRDWVIEADVYRPMAQMPESIRTNDCVAVELSNYACSSEIRSVDSSHVILVTTFR